MEQAPACMFSACFPHALEKRQPHHAVLAIDNTPRNDIEVPVCHVLVLRHAEPILLEPPLCKQRRAIVDCDPTHAEQKKRVKQLIDPVPWLMNDSDDIHA
jgi:hypothetical protein